MTIVSVNTTTKISENDARFRTRLLTSLETGWPPEETVQATIETKGELWQDHEYLAKPSGRWPEIHSRPPKGLRERAIPDYNWGGSASDDGPTYHDIAIGSRKTAGRNICQLR